jgi:TonB family protein
MKRIRIGLLSVILSASFSLSWGQSRTLYFDQYNIRCDSIEAHYIGKLTKSDSDKSKELLKMYGKEGRLNFEAEYLDYNEGIQDGIYREYYSEGQLKQKMNYTKGRRDGELISYYENGQMRRKELYKKGKLKQGQCYSLSGEETDYYPSEVMPTFKGGNKELRLFLAQNMKYPDVALKENISGTVYVHFVITPDGSIENEKVIQGVHPILDEEALRIVSLTNNRWNAGLLENEKVRVNYTVPITFQQY